jgi:hypothetical protein
MAWTLETLTQAIKDFCEYEEVSFVANIPVFIRSAEERIMHSVDLSLFRKNVSDMNFVGGNKYFDLPSDFLSAFALSYTYNTQTIFVLQKDVEFVREYGSLGTTGQPKYYALYDRHTFILSPIPEQSYTVELTYYFKPESITVSADGTSWLGENAEQALLYGTLIEAYTFMKGEADVLNMYNQRYMEALMRLKNFAEGKEEVDAYRGGLIRTQAN